MRRERGRPKPFREMVRPLADRRSWKLSVYYFLTFGGFVAMAVYLPVLLTEVFALRRRMPACVRRVSLSWRRLRVLWADGLQISRRQKSSQRCIPVGCCDGRIHDLSQHDCFLPSAPWVWPPGSGWATARSSSLFQNTFPSPWAASRAWSGPPAAWEDFSRRWFSAQYCASQAPIP